MEVQLASKEYVEETLVQTGTHKIIFVNPDTLAIEYIVMASPPFDLGITSLSTSQSNMRGINLPYIIVEASFEGEVTQTMLSEFQRKIAYEEIEDNYKLRESDLMSMAVDYDDYLNKETALKKLYFQVKMQIKTAVKPFELNLELK